MYTTSSDPRKNIRLAFSPLRVAAGLATVAVLLTTAGAAGQAARYVEGRDDLLAQLLRVLQTVFKLSDERTVSTWYSSSLLLVCAILLFVVASGEKVVHARYANHWRGLSLIFLFLSCDEAISIHERLGGPVNRIFPTSGFFLWAWVVPYAAFTLIFAVSYLRFLLHLPRRIRLLVFAAGTIYVAGALVLEAIEAKIFDASGQATLAVGILGIFEEFFEMIGVVIFAFAIMSYMALHQRLQVGLREKDPIRLPSRPKAPQVLNSRIRTFHHNRNR